MVIMVETLVTLPDDLKADLDRRAPNPPERDELVAAALRAYLAWPRRGEDAADLAIINAHAAELNAEAEDALSYQVPW
jgi:metal-responsive CopG/Arc/MetJ family transcriptional regulator